MTDGLVSGCVGTLQYIAIDKDLDEIQQLWFSFPGTSTGSIAKAKNHLLLPHIWLPEFQLHVGQSPLVYCKRSLSLRQVHFSVFQANAITIHKSQGATTRKSYMTMRRLAL